MKEEISLSKENKTAALKSIQQYFLTERDEELSEFQASLFLDFILGNIGIYIYNQALSDCHQFMHEKVEELFALEKRPK